MADPAFIEAVKWSTERLNDTDKKAKSFFFSLPFLFIGVILLVVVAVIVLWWWGRKKPESVPPQPQQGHYPQQNAPPPNYDQQAPQQPSAQPKRVVKRVAVARPRSPVEQEYVDEDGNKIDPSKVRA